MDRTTAILLRLIALGLGNDVEFDIPLEGVDWQEMIRRAMTDGLDAVAFDGVQALYKRRPDLADTLDGTLGGTKFKWMSFTLQAELDYEEYREKLQALAAFYNEAEIPVMVLKGYGLSLNYPIPQHRPTGDIDIYLFGRWKEADRLLAERMGIRIDNSHHHHSTFQFQELLVENHYDLTNVYVRPSNRRLEPLLKELAAREPVEWKMDGASILLPCADFNALFLLRHAALHFSSGYINLRQILDWLLFVREHGAEVDWKWLYGILERENMVHFTNSLNAIGVHYLGFAPEIFPGIEQDQALIDRVFGEILHPAFQDKEDGTLLNSLRVKMTRWWSNRWKYRLCFSDSLTAAFFHSLFAKFLKPKSFVH
ncbi:MAG: nucleotidyltransferase family protein [Bacteroidales bacterium]|nr:nucleotidyltransferase family protein [Bacteroidales bacterium]